MSIEPSNLGTDFNYTFILSELNEALTPYGTIETKPPDQSSVVVDGFESGIHFRTRSNPDSGCLELDLEDRILTVVLDESGSMTWNDHNRDRYTYLRRLLTKLDATYPGTITANLIGFGGVPTTTNLFLAQAGTNFLTADGLNFDQYLQTTFQDSVFDFAGVRIVRRIDRFPEHPADGVVVAEGIFEAIKDENLVEGQEYYYGVFCFNKDRHFTLGQYIRATPRDRILPRGVNFATADVRILPGVERDDFTQLIYNLTERSGGILFDSSGQNRHGSVGSQTIEENFWAGDMASTSFNNEGVLKQAVGIRFDGEFDLVEATSDDDIAFKGSATGSQSLTVNFWIFRYSQDSRSWIIGTSHEEVSNDVGWLVLLEPDGSISFLLDSDVDSSPLVFDTSGTSLLEVVPEKTWTMITLVLNADDSTAYLYVNGTILPTTHVLTNSTDTGGFDRLYIGAKPEDSNTTWSGADFFGCLAQISIHNTNRSSAYIQSLYEKELQIFDLDINEDILNPPDNLQREVLLSWTIGEDFNFENGRVVAVRKYNEIPAHIDDGTQVFSIAAEPGQSFYVDSFDLINNGNYYYRIFTVNDLGNICDRIEARILPVHIPASINPVASPELESVSSESITIGNKKLLLSWDAATDERVLGTKVFFGQNGFPVVSISAQGDLEVSDGQLIADITANTFTHRSIGTDCQGTDIPLRNGSGHFYTLVNYDRLGRISEPTFLFASPSIQSTEVFLPDNVSDLHAIVLNSQTVSLQWRNPALKTDRLDLYLGEAALAFVSVRDIFGGILEDVSNLSLQVCTTIENRTLRTSEQSLTNASNELTGNIENPCGDGLGAGGRGQFGVRFNENCNNEQAARETVVNYATVESGLVKGLITHTNDRLTLARRERYIMQVRAEYVVRDPNADSNSQPLFQFVTKPVSVTFRHPVKISLLNKLNKTILITNEIDEVRSLNPGEPCRCKENDQQQNEPKVFNGGYTGATRPYVCRVEIQFKGESLPDGTPINVQLFKHGSGDTPNPLNEKSNRTFITEGIYNTLAIFDEELDHLGNPTGQLISKSIVDIEILHPQLPDYVDLYVSFDYLGFFVDAVHEIRFIDSLFIRLDGNKPFPDGIDVAEQFATVWKINPDNPEETIPVPDGTLVKWEIEKGRFGKERPFYSTERLPVLLSGVYSATVNGVASNVFFGPVGNMEEHFVQVSCEEDDPGERCCMHEEYLIRASVIVNEESATDAIQFGWECRRTEQFSNKRFLVNAAPQQPGSNPHWITWADGTHLLKFQIAKNPAISTIRGADCFRSCVENVVGGQLFPIPDEHIVQITAPGEILWNVAFEEDPYTGELIPFSFESAVPEVNSDGSQGRIAVANIPVVDDPTDFYLRLNAFIGDEGNPKPQDCESGSGGGDGFGGSGGVISACEWIGICESSSDCIPVTGRRWENVGVLQGTTTLIAANKEVTLFGGGTYEEGIPPIYIGWKEPLDVRIVDARINGQRVNELVVDGVSQHTFVVEMTFAGEAVPDGTPIEITIEGSDQDVVLLSNCVNAPAGCFPASNGVVYTRKINDPIINPSGLPRSLAYFSINPLPNIDFAAKINVTARYDKVGTVTREITRCIEIANSTNQDQNDSVPGSDDDPVTESASSNEVIVYDTTSDTYQTTTSSRVRRIGAFAAATTTGTSDSIYLFGGYTGNGDGSTNSLTPIGERFNTNTLEWEFITNMQTARAYGQVVVVDEQIYCIGGIELDPVLGQYVVSRKIEVFDIRTELWNTTLDPMPENYGVAYGSAHYYDGYIYVICGITSVVDNSKAVDLNDRVLRYSIADNEWVSILVDDLDAYQRIAPFSFVRSKNTPPEIYVYAGSIPKTPSQIESERQNKINALLDQFRSFILTNSYYLNLSLSEQKEFITEKETEIRNSVNIPAFIYPFTGFKFSAGSETTIDNKIILSISDSLDDEWHTLPMPRDHGQAVYMPVQDTVYFIGGSNQNKSTTLNRNEAIGLVDNLYIQNTPLARGRAMFSAVTIDDDIYIIGGLTSGHAEGWLQIEVVHSPEFIECLGTQSGGVFITLKNDSGDLIEEPVRVNVQGRVRIPEIDSILVEYQSNRAADRALGGDGSGNAPDIPDGDDSVGADRKQDAQNKITDPNSDQYQFNAARKLNEQIELFPVLFSENEFVIESGVGGTTLLPRAEDPLADFQLLARFVETLIENTPTDPDERFEGNLTREELAALGETLATVELPPTIIDSGALRELYDIETIVTVLDDRFFGQTVSDLDLQIQNRIEERIDEILTPDDDNEGGSDGSGFSGGAGGIGLGGPGSGESECFILQHSAQPDIPPPDTPPGNDGPNNPAGTGGLAQSGQCLFCESILPLRVNIRSQMNTALSKYFNATDWIPQIKRRATGNMSTINDVLNLLDIISFETPFGSSQLYNALFAAAETMTGDTFEEQKKVIYVASDNSQNLSVVTREQAVEEINSIDGNRRTPVVYTVFSTSFPISLTAMLERAESGDVEKIGQDTGGQSATLISSVFLDQILNLTIGGATGGLGYGVYRNILDLNATSAITSLAVEFLLPLNTRGFIRFRHSRDGYNFSDFTQRFEGSQTIDFVDFFARYIEFEIVLTTGFTADITDEYDTIATGSPRLCQLVWEISGERQDFIFINPETVPSNAQQVAMAFEGSIPASSIVELGVATSRSHHWEDFQSPARPAVIEHGKTFLVERSDVANSVVPTEHLTTLDYRLYKSVYGPWDPTASIELFRVNSDGTELPVLNGYRAYAREGEILFDTRQNPSDRFKLTVVNDSQLQVAMRLRNRLHTDSIGIEGVGYIYSTNNVRPPELSQVAPRAINVTLAPQTPTAGDTFFVLYTYSDLNGNPELGTIISWYKNGIQLLEVQNRESFTNNDLILSHKLQPGDKLQASVTPSDGRDFGATVFSSPIVIIARPPGVEDVRIVPIRNGIVNDRFDTSSTFKCEYNFQVEDEGPNAVEDGTVVRWIVNGILFKEEIYSDLDIGSDGQVNDSALLLEPTELNGGQTAHLIGNQIQVEVLPKTAGGVIGDLVRSNTIIVENSVPRIVDISIEPLNPTTESTLVVGYQIEDGDIARSLQTDQSEILWFKSLDGVTFTEVPELKNEPRVTPFSIRSGEHWKAQVQPFDGLDLGISAETPVVVVV